MVGSEDDTVSHRRSAAQNRETATSNGGIVSCVLDHLSSRSVVERSKERLY